MAVYYRTADGQEDYQFSFEFVSGSWRAYIVSKPSYRGRDESSEETHRLLDGNRRYVCWTEILRTEADAWKVAALWAEGTQTYIATGDFDPSGRGDPQYRIRPTGHGTTVPPPVASGQETALDHPINLIDRIRARRG